MPPRGTQEATLLGDAFAPARSRPNQPSRTTATHPSGGRPRADQDPRYLSLSHCPESEVQLSSLPSCKKVESPSCPRGSLQSAVRGFAARWAAVLAGSPGGGLKTGAPWPARHPGCRRSLPGTPSRRSASRSLRDFRATRESHETVNTSGWTTRFYPGARVPVRPNSLGPAERVRFSKGGFPQNVDNVENPTARASGVRSWVRSARRAAG